MARTCTLIAAGAGTLLLGLAAGAPAQAKLASNGLTWNGIGINGLTYNGLAVPAQAGLGALRVESVTLPATKAE